MLEPKFAPYITLKKAFTKHGVRYNVLSEDAPESLKQEYLRLIQYQDEEAAKGKPISKF